jgi:hypothetical protein
MKARPAVGSGTYAIPRCHYDRRTGTVHPGRIPCGMRRSRLDSLRRISEIRDRSRRLRNRVPSPARIRGCAAVRTTETAMVEWCGS